MLEICSFEFEVTIMIITSTWACSCCRLLETRGKKCYISPQVDGDDNNGAVIVETGEFRIWSSGMDTKNPSSIH